jgi:putative transposase
MAMARRPRLDIIGVPQHVVQRGNNRQGIFCRGEDYRFYLACLGEAARKHDCSVHAYVLMTNHVHLLATPHVPHALSLAMQDLGRNYAQYFNAAHERTGTLWEGRFKADLVQTQCYFLTCCRYIELNPVRAGLVERPEQYPWSSYCRHAWGKEDPVLLGHDEYRALGANDAERQRAYRDLFGLPVDEQALEDIRGTVNGGWPLGNERFKDDIEAASQRAARPPRRGRPRKTADHHGRMEFAAEMWT